MTKEEYNNLKYGDVVTHCTYRGYYIVHDTFDDECLDPGDKGRLWTNGKYISMWNTNDLFSTVTYLLRDLVQKVFKSRNMKYRLTEEII